MRRKLELILKKALRQSSQPPRDFGGQSGLALRPGSSRQHSGQAGQALGDATELSVPENAQFGHYSTSAALKLAKAKKKNPMDLAAELAAKIEKNAPQGFFEKIEVAAPGFINFWISKDVVRDELLSITKQKEKYGKQTSRRASLNRTRGKQGKKIMVEFTDPNPFKEFHIGHLYSNIVGESLSRILEANGAAVKRANYQGDVGLHVAKAVWGMMTEMRRKKVSLKELEKKSLDYRIEFMGAAYVKGSRAYEKDAKAKLEIVELNKKIFAFDPEIRNVYAKGRRWSLDYFEKIYKRLGTKFDFYYFESNVGKVGLRIVKENIKKGIFEESQGAIVFPGEKYGLHRRVFINSEGLPTYEAKELGLEVTKYRDSPCDTYIIVTGNEILDYFKVLLAALKQINPRLEKKVKHVAHGMVRLEQGKMSSRTGEVIKAEDLLDEMKERVLKIMKTSAKTDEETAESIAVGAVKYAFLKTNIGQDIIFNFDESLSLKGDSGPYLQYTHARLKSILRKARKVSSIKYQVSSLNEEAELALIRKMAEFPETVRRGAEVLMTNGIAKYLYELANLANRYYESTPILTDKNVARRNARLVLINSVASIIKTGLGLLGIKAPDKI